MSNTFRNIRVGGGCREFNGKAKTHSDIPYGSNHLVGLHKAFSDTLTKFVNWVKVRLYHEKLYLMDIFCIGYMILTTMLLLIFRHNVPNWADLASRFAFFTVIIHGVIVWFNRYPDNLALSMLRFVYPVGVIAFGWGHMNDLVLMIYGDLWATTPLVALDRFFFGTYPTVWFQQFHSPWLYEFMNFFYCGYYLWMPVIVLVLLLRKEFKALAFTLSLVSFTYLGNYILFYLLPAVGPQMTPEIMAVSSNADDGFWIAQLTKTLQSGGEVAGGAFPSSHVSVALAWALAVWHLNRRIGVWFLLMVPFIAVATAYLGYHHAMDPIAGLLWGYMSYCILVPGYQ